MKASKFIAQVTSGAMALTATGFIHYKVHPISEISTVANAFAAAFSFWPGMIIGYGVSWIQRHLAGDEEPDVPAAAALCGILWFVYLFRALTLLVGVPILSNWTQGPVNWIVRAFEFFVHLG